MSHLLSVFYNTMPQIVLSVWFIASYFEVREICWFRLVFLSIFCDYCAYISNVIELILELIPSCYQKGIVDVLCQACERLGWKKPTSIQREAIPVALEGEFCCIRYVNR